MPFHPRNICSSAEIKGSQLPWPGEDLSLCLAKLSNGMWPGEAVFENQVNKKVERATVKKKKKKPNKPQALTQQGLLPPSTSFLKSYLLWKLAQGNLPQKSSEGCLTLAARTSRRAAERSGSSPFAGGEMSAEGRSQDQISLGQLRC